MTRNKNASGKGKGQGKGASSAAAMAHTRSRGPPPSEAEEVDSEASGSRLNDDSIYYVTRSESIGTDTIPSHSNLGAEVNPEAQHQGEGGTGSAAQPGEETLVEVVSPELVEDHETLNQGGSDNLDGQTDKPGGPNGTIASARGERRFVSSHCFADLRREIAFIRQEMFRVSPSQWTRARNEFHARLAELEARMQEDAFSHVDELISAGYQARAQMTQKSLDKLLDLLTDSQELANRECSPSTQIEKPSEQTRDGLSSASAPVDRSSAIPGKTNGNCTEWEKSAQIGRAAREGLQHLEGRGHHEGGPSGNSGGSDQANLPFDGGRRRPATANVQAKGSGLSHKNMEQSKTSNGKFDGVPRHTSTRSKEAETRQQTGCENRSRGDYRGTNFQDDRGYCSQDLGRGTGGVGNGNYSNQNPYWREDNSWASPCFPGQRPYCSAPGSFGGPSGQGQRHSVPPGQFGYGGFSDGAILGRIPIFAQNEGEQFYHQLPWPWNVVPNQLNMNQSDYMKMSFQQNFSGKLEEYETFRALFIPIKHAADVPVALKHYALAGSLTGSAQDLVQGTLPTASGYALLINRLEENFGGLFRQLDRGMDRIRKIKEVRPGHWHDLESLVRAVDAYAASLGDRGHELYVHGNFVAVEEKLSVDMRREYRVWCSVMRREADHLDNLMDWLRNVQLPPLRREKDREMVRKPDRHSRVHLNTVNRDCPMCVGTEEHGLVHCEPFSRMAPFKRRNLLSLLRRCFLCLAAEHISRDCPTPNKCSHCGGMHHDLLHLDNFRNPVKSSRSNLTMNFEEDDPSVFEPVTEHHASPTMVTHPSVPDSMEHSLRFSSAKICCPGRSKILEENVLCDDGSNITLIDEGVAQELGLEGERIQTKITGVGGKVEVYSALYTEVEISSMSGKVRRRIKAKVIPSPAGNLFATNWANHKEAWPHLRKLPFLPPVGGGKCRIILGTDQAYLLQSLEEISGATSYEPIARRTPLGWTCVGPVFPAPRVGEEKTFLSFRATGIVEGTDMPDRLLTSPVLCRPGDRKALKAIVDSSVRVGDRIQVPVLWKDGTRPGNNFFQAKGRWQSLRNQLSKEPGLLERYQEVVSGWEKKGYARPVPLEEVGARDAYFLPHFPVRREDKQSTKLRIVMDGKSTYRGVGLNDCVLPGPKVINSLFDVVARFRRFPVAVVGDAKEMFLRILLSPEDRRYHRFVYSPPGTEECLEYENMSHVFGNRGSLTNAVTTVKLSAIRHETEQPLAADVVLRGSLVDDNLGSVMTIKEAKAVVGGLQKIYGDVGMHIHKWSSSHKEVLSDLSPDDLAGTVSLRDLSEENDGTLTKALGIVWSVNGDFFTYCYEAPEMECFTQRNLLKLYMAIFDPMGWVGPYVMAARMLYRDTCALKLGWDAPVPDVLARRWQGWFAQLPELKGMSIPRWVGMKRGEEGCLHIFSDASSDAYGACAYWASGPLMKADSCTLLASRGKVNSSDARSIPQLELMGAVLGLDLAKSVCRALDLELDRVFFWVDAENTLYRVLCPPSKMEKFVARRVSILREETNLFNWRWVGTHDNPADAISRGLSASKLLGNSLWWSGPLFLTTGEPWPTLKVEPLPHIELEGEAELLRLIGIYCTSGETAQQYCWENSSEFQKNCRVMRLVLKFVHRLRKGLNFPDSPAGARLALMRWEQVKNWPYEVSLLERGDEIPVRHPWRAWDCQISDGLIQIHTRSGGRLVLLPNKSFLTRQWLRHLHENELHHVGGHRSLLAESRKYAWVVHGIAECKSILWQCVTCRRRDPMPKNQKMGPLPEFRCAPKDGVPVAFATAGLDVAGPFFTKQGRGKVRQKRYLLLFCCTVFRAVHLEMLYGLETSDILLALQRFASRKGMPLQLVSDNASYFRRAAVELEGGVYAPGVTSAWREVRWLFNPPLAPHTGGVFERLIGSAKRAISAVMGGAHLWDDELSSAFVFVEGIMNCRPLDFMSTNESDLSPLTPGHFLVGPRVQEMAFSDLEGGSPYSKRWRHINQTVENYWLRFLREIKPSLGLRTKWHSKTKNLEHDDVVVVLGEKDLKGRWPLGRVTQTHAGKDGLVRMVTVKVQGRQFKRHVNCMMPLFKD